ncbi:hypothetical protein GCM10007978_01610 [Shewanella hanedai]|uniref:Basal-body rod modification protein FlgD n=1 Tax=Shewanella hanedai TaxID=25 RepID=A0A553JUZ0_SHEHA|nr:flagellar hook capping FlgD N-terminal domain-containing protein [Shewanella hanedai]TRY16273.1 flagellar hook capping protein [Shewanella hanedai]GGI67619.1 hypothetical protein GCM10007978_01610 [Shewanella hanedai]
MDIQSIGGNSSTANSTQSNIKLDDFLQLFVAQLNYQDPLEPVNNSEFLAQLAQFSSLEINRQSNDNSLSLLAIGSSDQALGLIGRSVEVSTQSGQAFIGDVTGVNFTQEGPMLTVKGADNSLLTDIKLGQITVVK